MGNSISFDTWGLLVTGVVITVLWLAFRRMFPKEPPAGSAPKKPDDPK